MQLDLLSIDVCASRYRSDNEGFSIRANVVPAGHDTIRIGSRHIFAQHNFKSDLTRIDAQLSIIQASDAYIDDFKGLIPEGVPLSDNPVGFARAHFPTKGAEGAILSFEIIVSEKQIDCLVTLIDGVTAGDVTIDLTVEGLAGRLPDEDIWEQPADGRAQLLPISHFSVDVAKLKTTRRAIRDARDALVSEELADSDDAEKRKVGLAGMKDARELAAEQNTDPALTILRHCRTLLVFLLVFLAVTVIQRL